jgi:endonuclease/exonuclease/phosphatase family metal-dependent hydrolase
MPAGSAAFLIASLALGAALCFSLQGLGSALPQLPPLPFPPLALCSSADGEAAWELSLRLHHAAATGSGGGGFSSSTSSSPQRLAAAAAALAACGALAAAALLHSELVVVSFVLGRTHGGLGTLLRRSKFRLIASESRNLAHQGGDFLNLLRPRAFQALLVELVGAEGSYTLILNCHTNLGSDAARSLQIDEVVRAGGPAALGAMLDRAGLRGLVRPEDVPVLLLGDLNATAESASVRAAAAEGFVDSFLERRRPDAAACSWDARNPLTNGYVKEPDSRIDYVLYRPARYASAGAGAAPEGASPAAPSDTADAFNIRAAASSICLSRPPFTSDHFGIATDFLASGVGLAPAAAAAAAAEEELDAAAARLHRSVLAAAKKGEWTPPSPSALELTLPHGGYMSSASSEGDAASPTVSRSTPRSFSSPSLNDPEEEGVLGEGEEEEFVEGALAH